MAEGRINSEEFAKLILGDDKSFRIDLFSFGKVAFLISLRLNELEIKQRNMFRVLGTG